MNGIIALDEMIEAMMDRLAPELGILDAQRPYSVSDDIALPAPVMATINSWLSFEED